MPVNAINDSVLLKCASVCSICRWVVQNFCKIAQGTGQFSTEYSKICTGVVKFSTEFVQNLHSAQNFCKICAVHREICNEVKGNMPSLQ